MRPILFALMLSGAFPAMAQETDAPGAADQGAGEGGLMERGLRLFVEGLIEEMEPALRDLEDLARDVQPFLERLEGDFGQALRDPRRAERVRAAGDPAQRQHHPAPQGAAARGRGAEPGRVDRPLGRVSSDSFARRARRDRIEPPALDWVRVIVGLDPTIHGPKRTDRWTSGLPDQVRQ